MRHLRRALIPLCICVAASAGTAETFGSAPVEGDVSRVLSEASQLTTSPPTVSSVGSTSASFGALVDPGGRTTTVRFVYGPRGYGSATAPIVLEGGGAQPVSATVTALAPATDYYVTVVAWNARDTEYGGPKHFRTASAAGGGTTDPRPGGESGPVSPGPPSAPASPSPAPPSPSSTLTPSSGDSPEPPAGVAAEPAMGRTVVLAPVRGMVLVSPREGPAAPLVDGAAVPVGSVIDTRRGEVELTSAVDAHGGTQTGRFSGGVFSVRQHGNKGMTEIALRGSFAGCPRPRGTLATAAARSKRKGARAKVNSLWASDEHGRFRTRGRDSVATVRGTVWQTVERCDGTLTRVTEGRVDVRDLGRGKTVTVRAGERYLARHAR